MKKKKMKKELKAMRKEIENLKDKRNLDLECDYYLQKIVTEWEKISVPINTDDEDEDNDYITRYMNKEYDNLYELSKDKSRKDLCKDLSSENEFVSFNIMDTMKMYPELDENVVFFSFNNEIFERIRVGNSFHVIHFITRMSYKDFIENLKSINREVVDFYPNDIKKAQVIPMYPSKSISFEYDID